MPRFVVPMALVPRSASLAPSSAMWPGSNKLAAPSMLQPIGRETRAEMIQLIHFARQRFEIDHHAGRRGRWSRWDETPRRE